MAGFYGEVVIDQRSCVHPYSNSPYRPQGFAHEPPRSSDLLNALASGTMHALLPSVAPYDTIPTRVGPIVTRLKGKRHGEGGRQQSEGERGGEEEERKREHANPCWILRRGCQYVLAGIDGPPCRRQETTPRSRVRTHRPISLNRCYPADERSPMTPHAMDKEQLMALKP